MGASEENSSNLYTARTVEDVEKDPVQDWFSSGEPHPEPEEERSSQEEDGSDDEDGSGDDDDDASDDASSQCTEVSMHVMSLNPGVYHDDPLGNSANSGGNGSSSQELINSDDDDDDGVGVGRASSRASSASMGSLYACETPKSLGSLYGGDSDREEEEDEDRDSSDGEKESKKEADERAEEGEEEPTCVLNLENLAAHNAILNRTSTTSNTMRETAFLPKQLALKLAANAKKKNGGLKSPPPPPPPVEEEDPEEEKDVDPEDPYADATTANEETASASASSSSSLDHTTTTALSAGGTGTTGNNNFLLVPPLNLSWLSSSGDHQSQNHKNHNHNHNQLTHTPVSGDDGIGVLTQVLIKQGAVLGPQKAAKVLFVVSRR